MVEVYCCRQGAMITPARYASVVLWPASKAVHMSVTSLQLQDHLRSWKHIRYMHSIPYLHVVNCTTSAGQVKNTRSDSRLWGSAPARRPPATALHASSTNTAYIIIGARTPYFQYLAITISAFCTWLTARVELFNQRKPKADTHKLCMRLTLLRTSPNSRPWSTTSHTRVQPSKDTTASSTYHQELTSP